MQYLWPALAVLLGIAALIFGADRFVFGASSLARRMGVSPLVVGMIIVGIGTSSPEILVSAIAAFDHNGGIALGNVVGSNITNIAMVAGISALIRPIDLHRDVVRREMPVLLLVTAIAIGMMIDLELDRVDGTILVVLLGLFLFRTLRSSRAAEEPGDEQHTPTIGVGRATLWLVVGLGLLVGGSRGVVWGASTIASALGISELIIGLTIVAVGTSLPELASSVAAALKGEHAMAIGNVIGSNVFNLLAVLPFPALIDPGEFERDLLVRDAAVMGGLTVLLLLFSIGIGGKQGRVNRFEGGFFVLVFAGYIAVLVLAATGHSPI